MPFGRAEAVCAPPEEDLGGWELEIVERNADTEGFAVLPHRRIVERTLGWLMRSRRIGKDLRADGAKQRNLIEVAMIRLILRRLAKGV